MTESSSQLDQIGEFDQAEDATVEKKRRKWPWVTAAVFAGVCASYVGVAAFYASKVPAHAQVAGVDIGGLTKDEAGELIEQKLSPRLAQKVSVTVGEHTKEINPSSFKSSLDVPATLKSFAGFTLNPVELWNRITGGGEYEAVVKVDDSQLSSVLAELAKETNTEPSNATLSFNGVTPVTTPASRGYTLDQAAAVDKVKKSLLASSPIKLPVQVKEADITDEEAAKALQELATPLVSSNLSVNVNTTLVTLTPEHLASAASFEPKDGVLSLKMDAQSLGKIVREQAPDLLKEGRDARIEIVNHERPHITPSQDGVGIDEADLAAKVASAGVSKDRTIDVATTAIPASFTTADAQALGIKEVVSSIETPLTNDSVRTTNLVVGTKKITGTVVKPGETFSLLKALGPITAENGFTSSGVVANGFNSTAMGGGLSQLSTNTFNIGYLAGFEDVEHKPHSKYFSRYPMGREATLWEGQIDMKWKNTTPYGAMIDTWVANGKVYSRLWSTKHFDVETSTSAPYNHVAPATKTNPAADCEPSGAGGPGFTVTVRRKVSLHGSVVEDKSYAWTYRPVDAVVCE